MVAFLDENEDWKTNNNGKITTRLSGVCFCPLNRCKEWKCFVKGQIMLLLRVSVTI